MDIPILKKSHSLTNFHQNRSFADYKGTIISPKSKFKSLFLLEKNYIIELELFFKSSEINNFFNFINFLIKFYNSKINTINKEINRENMLEKNI